MNKKFIILIGAVVGLIIVGLIVFWIFYAKKSPGPTTETPGLFPTGEKISSPLSPPSITQQPAPTTQTRQLKSLVQLTQKPVIGAIYVPSTSAVRYFEKATGHIYDLDLLSKNSTRVSNTTIPGIFEVLFSPDGNEAIIRYAETNDEGVESSIRNFSLSDISGTTTPRGIFMLSAIKAFTVSPKENKIFYLSPVGDFNTGVVSSFSDKNQKQALLIPFGEFNLNWPAEKVITLLSKPSAQVEGYFYRLDPVSGDFGKILGGFKGLTALYSPDGKYIVYSESGFNDFKTSIYAIEEKKTSPLNATTLPEKCVWSKLKKGTIYCAVPTAVPQATYPDDWYQGLVSFSDRVWKIDTISGETAIISAESETEIDLINPFLSNNGDYFFFQNKKNNTLWSLQLEIL